MNKENNLGLKMQVETINSNLVKSYKWFKIKDLISNNFDIKAIILRFYFCSFWFNIFLVGISLIANIIYGGLLFFKLFNIEINGATISNWKWEIGLPIINILFIVFIIKTFSSIYKLSLRGNYRNSYLKLLVLDICTLNIFDVLATLIFAKNRKHMSKIHNDFSINKKNLNSQNIANFLKPLFKLTIKVLLVSIIVFLVALVISLFVQKNSIKLVCLAFIFWSIAIFYVVLMCDIGGLIFIQIMFKKLLVNNSYYYFISTLRILMYFCGYYVLAILLVSFNFDEADKKYILENL